MQAADPSQVLHHLQRLCHRIGGARRTRAKARDSSRKRERRQPERGGRVCRRIGKTEELLSRIRPNRPIRDCVELVTVESYTSFIQKCWPKDVYPVQRGILTAHVVHGTCQRNGPVLGAETVQNRIARK